MVDLPLNAHGSRPIKIVADHVTIRTEKNNQKGINMPMRNDAALWGWASADSMQPVAARGRMPTIQLFDLTSTGKADNLFHFSDHTLTNGSGQPPKEVMQS